MSGSFEDIHVPPTLVSFAVTTQKTGDIISPEFKAAGHRVVQLIPQYGKDGLPVSDSLLETFDTVTKLMRGGHVAACYTPGMGGLAEAVLKMGIGNGIGFEFDESLSLKDIFGKCYCTFLMELADDAKIPAGSYAVRTVGETGCSTAAGSCCDSVAADQKSEECISWRDGCIGLADLQKIYEDKLESVFACNIEQGDGKEIENYRYEAKEWPVPLTKPAAAPKVLIPVFPGNNCEYDSAKVMRDAGAAPEIYVIKNLTADAVSRSVDEFAAKIRESQMIFIPGGFSGGDEPDGSGKFITAFFRNHEVKEAVGDLLDVRGGLMCGICNGFQALIKLGLVPYGKIIDTDASCPTLTFNTIGRHQSRIVRTRIASNKSPWLSLTNVGDIYSVPISHGEGRFLASDELIRELAANGQIATQYVDLDGNATADIHFNPNNSMAAIEGITSPDGRVFGKMGHAERTGAGLYKNVPGNYDIRMFEAAVKFFK